MKRILALWAFMVGGWAVAGAPAPDLVIAGFEAAGYGDWRATGEAFGPGPARGTLPNQMRVEGYLGDGLVNSYHGGDRTVGTLTSPEFEIQRRYLSFLIGGGKDSEKLCMNLVIDGRIVRTATGPNDRPGGSEALAPAFWDVQEFLGRTAVIQIVDRATGGWGHINVDQLVQTDARPSVLVAGAEREFRVERRYLNLPIKNGAPKRAVRFLVDGRVEVENEIELADREADWWAFVDVERWRGRTVTVRVDQLPEDSAALSAVEQSDALRGAEDLYREPLRGQFHFSSRRGWNNDPNGLAYFDGEYHLFYQHNPYGWAWGNMHWGHAVSRDLVHWEELGDVLFPDAMGPMFSGSAVVDWDNTSGLGRDGHPPLVLFYTAAGNPAVQCLAWSLDGRAFTKFGGNPVIDQITPGNRDPKVFWHAPTGKWVMVLYVELPEKRHTVHFLTSPNLKDWTVTSWIEGFYECPDIFELAVDDDSENRKWVLTAASSEYMLGTFDGRRFTPETPKLPGHRGRGFYAAQTFSDIPARDGRRIQIGWFRTETPGMPFNQSMTVPLVLTLRSTRDGPRLAMNPAAELWALRARTYDFGALDLTTESPNPLVGFRGELVELRAEFEPEPTAEVVFEIRGATVAYDAVREELRVNGQRAPAPLREGRQRLVIYCDRTALEVFAADGFTYVPMPFLPEAEDRTVSVRVEGGKARVRQLHVHELEPAWKVR